MNFLQAVAQVSFLGLIQGLTEFLPISSSGHLVILQKFFPLISQQPMTLGIVLHLGSLLALLVFWAPKIKSILLNRKLIGLIVTATVLTAAIILPFQKIVETVFSDTKCAGIMLMLTGLILFFASKKRNNSKEKTGLKEALTIGVSQALAAFPGMSRSGMTISTGIFSNLQSRVAVEFSFLLAIPILAGAVILEIPRIASVSSDLLLIYGIGSLVSFAVSLCSLKFITKSLKLNQKKLAYFAYYCWLIGLTAIFAV